MTTLRSILDAEIERQGAISFARFMEIALYTPDLGYYERAQAVGAAADFYTSVSVGPLLGELLAFQFSLWLRELDASRLRLIEAGAHHGQLACDILGWFERHESGLFERIDYIILEPSAALQEKQRNTLTTFAQSVRWIRRWEDLDAKQTGIFFSNELLDAFPAHIICWNEFKQIWTELGVTRSDASYVWTPLQKLTLDREVLPQLPSDLLDVLPDGFRTEVNSAALDWWRKASNVLQSGWLMTVDYGFDTEEFFAPQRARGTARGFQKHRPVDDVLANPGSQDITTHVDFSKLLKVGEHEGLGTVEYTTQTRFLTQVVEKMAANASSQQWTPARLRQFQTLTHPDHLGRNFRVLIQKTLPVFTERVYRT